MPAQKKKCPKTTILSMILILFLSTIVFLILFHPNKPPVHDVDQPQNVCMTEKCIRSAARILKMIDKTIDPCDNFYNFVCSNFIKNTIVADEQTVVTQYSLINDKVKHQFKELLGEDILPEDSNSLKLLKTAYQTCINTSQIEEDSLPFLRKIFKDLGGWPLIDSNWNERKFDWKHVLYRLRRIGWNFDFFINLDITIDLKNSSKRILSITQPFIPNVLSLRKGLNDSKTQSYYDYMVKIVKLFGAPELSASVEMNEVLEFEINLSKIIVLYNSRRNISSTYNPTRIRDLQDRIHGIPWLQLVNNFLAPLEVLTSKDIINIELPQFLENLEDLLLNTKKRTLANYMFWYIVKNSAHHLPEKFRKVVLEYQKSIGLARSERRWEQCVKEVIKKLHLAASYVYVKKFFKMENKKGVDEIASYVKEAFIEKLEAADWIDPETKKHSLLKAEKLKLHIAFHDELLDEEKIDEYYRGLILNSDGHFLKVNLNLSSFLRKKLIRRLREDVHKSEWSQLAFSYVANAFYDLRENAIEVMAALLQDNFFDSERPQYLNFGSIGEIIGHKITHGFDEEGKQFDENGNLVDWWAKETLQTFSKKSECLIGQYRNTKFGDTKKNVNGLDTLNENIADNGAFKIAYRGYLKWVEKNQEEAILPGLPYSPSQLFWISAASDGCAKYKNKDTLERYMVGYKHSPKYFRIMVPFMNNEDFARDFNCSLGMVMNPEKKCQVW